MIKEGRNYNECLDEIWKEIKGDCVSRKKAILEKFKGPYEEFDKLYLYENNYILANDKNRCICGKSIGIIKAICTKEVILLIGTTCFNNLMNEDKIKKKSEHSHFKKKQKEICLYCKKKETFGKYCGDCLLIVRKKCLYCKQYKIKKRIKDKPYCKICSEECNKQELQLICDFEKSISEKNIIIMVEKIKYYDLYKTLISGNNNVLILKKINELIKKSYELININNIFFEEYYVSSSYHLCHLYRPCKTCLKFLIRNDSKELFCENCL